MPITIKAPVVPLTNTDDFILTDEMRVACAMRSWEAEKARQEIEPFSSSYPALTRQEGYAIQAIRENLVLAEGHRLSGYKLGSTGMAKRRQMGTATSSYGRLFSYMDLSVDRTLHLSRFIHPKIEPEVSFLLARDLSGPFVTSAEVMASTAGIIASLEIIDSRFINFKFTGPDVVSDNTSGSGYVLSDRLIDPNSIDLSSEGLHVRVNGELYTSATAAEILGHPARAVAEFANIFYAHTGRSLKAGQVIMTGGITAAFPLKANDFISAEFSHLGTITLHVV